MNLLKLLDERAEQVLAVFAMIVMVILVFIQVIFRYVINASLSWSEELARYAHIWMVWLSASYAVRKSAHIKVEMVKNIFNMKTQKVINVIALLLWFAFALFFAWQGLSMVLSVMERGQRAAATRIPMWIVYIALPLGGFLMSFRLVQRLYFLFNSAKAAEEVETK
ncbi:MAG: TRAP transporter small permease [Tindallia sp. MSAO_Bac2]|nr:MAG: TRAP transporter small permease [Tindallia sp. MSAO_Bac2]